MLTQLKIKGLTLETCIIQGGMGMGISLHPLVQAVGHTGGLGVLSSVGLDCIVSTRKGKRIKTYEAVREEIELAQGGSKKPVGINIMCALVRDYEQTVRAAIDAKVSAIISGAGLPMWLGTIKNIGDTARIPIVSSARALTLICKRWEKHGNRPDAVVLEGPLAGGHLGFKYDDINKPEHRLEVLLPQVLDVAHKYGGFPVIVAGGIYSHMDILSFLAQGASGVQMGTRFLATVESSAPQEYKQAVLNATKKDITIVAPPHHPPASPCGLPFRVLTTSPLYTTRRIPKCTRGYVLQPDADGKLTQCMARPDNPQNDNFLCICAGLASSAGYAPQEPPLWTVGSNAYRVQQVVPVAELMKELIGT